MTGIDILDQARTQAPGAKTPLLTAYADTDVAIEAINDIGLDYYLLKPCDPPEERLYPIIASHVESWPLPRPPFALETSAPGVFAAGDVRLDSTQRVASAVDEGAMSVSFVHRYLATI